MTVGTTTKNDPTGTGNPLSNQLERIDDKFDLGGQVHQDVGVSGDKPARRECLK